MQLPNLDESTRKGLNELTAEEVSRSVSYAYEHEMLWYGIDAVAHAHLMRMAKDISEGKLSQEEFAEKYSLDFEDTVDPIDLTFEQYDVKLVVDEKILNEIIGDVEVDYRIGNLVEQGFIFKRLKYAHVCGCGESFTPVKDIPADGKQNLGWH